MPKDMGEKLQDDDLHHAYDAVRVANKSVSSLTPNIYLSY